MENTMLTPKMKLLKGTDAIQKAITSILIRGKKLDRDIHVAGVSCLQHIEEHGDVTLLNRLVEAMPKGSRVNALREWAECYGKVKFNNETRCFDHCKKSSTLLEDAIETSWVEFKPEPQYKTMNFQDELNKLIAKAYDRADTDKGDTIDFDAVKRVATAIGYKATT